jgi:ComEC/Rec2-related protein
MLFGTKYSKMPADFFKSLVTTGTLHVVALSGTNVTILIKLVRKFTGHLATRVSAVVILGVIFGFVLFVGGDPPIVRAAIMGGISTIGDFSGKRQYGFFSLLFASGLMLLVRPFWLYSLSFQLSALATLGIIAFDSQGSTSDQEPAGVAFFSSSNSHLQLQRRSASVKNSKIHAYCSKTSASSASRFMSDARSDPPNSGSPIFSQPNLLSRLRKSFLTRMRKSCKISVTNSYRDQAEIVKKISLFDKIVLEVIDIVRELWIRGRSTFRENLRTTLAAQVFITPLLVYNFGRISFISPLANAVSLWSVEVLTWGGVALSLGGAIPIVGGVVGKIIGLVVWVFLEYFIVVVELFAKVPFSEVVL